jgi:hypothetical protein
MFFTGVAGWFEVYGAELFETTSAGAIGLGARALHD